MIDRTRNLLNRSRCVEAAWRRWVALLAAIAAGLFVLSANAANFSGSLQISAGLTFYVVNHAGKDFTVCLHWRDPMRSTMDRPLLVRVFDPDERLLVRHDEPGRKTAGEPPTSAIELTIAARGSGVYQVIVTGTGSLEFRCDPELPWGVYGVPHLAGNQDQFSETFIYIPPALEQIQIRCEGQLASLQLNDETGGQRLSLRGANPAGQVSTSGESGKVWKLSARALGEYRMDFRGLPIILCPDAETARAIRGSVDVLDDGTICFHKFQVRAQKILNRYRQLLASAFHVDPPTLVRFKDQWQQQPQRNRLLFGPYGVYAGFPAVLREQNLDGSSPWFGTIGVWRDHVPRERQENPWARYDRSGLTSVAQHVSVLAAVCALNHAFNPLYQNDALRNRVIVGALQELMLLREHELPQATLDLYYGGERAFSLTSLTRPFQLVARDCPEDVRAVWTEGLQRYVDRQAIGHVADTVNQWSFAIRGIQQFAEAVDDPWYASLVKRHLRLLLTRNQWNFGHMPAGYFSENEGPDATYSGITLHNLAWVYERTGDQALLQAIRESFRLFNHTIAPEPAAGSAAVHQQTRHWYGSSSFCHRTPGDFTQPQFGAGVGMLADDLPEAAVHVGRVWVSPRPARSAPELRQALNELPQWLTYLRLDAFRDPNIGAGTIGGGPDLHFAVWEHFATDPLDGELPVLAEQQFTRNFGDEFFCVRRPSYYAFLYAGKSMGEWQRPRVPADPRRQYPRNGGGLCMFWSPAFGTSMLSKNWSAYAANCIIAERSGGAADWEDYWSIDRTFDVDRATAVVTGQLRHLPIAFERNYRFADDHLECRLTLRADATAALSAMWECFPFPLEKFKADQVVLLNERGQSIDNGPASAVMFRSSSREAHLLVFAEPRRCSVGNDEAVDVYGAKHRHGRVLAELPSTWRAGDAKTVRWAMLAVDAERAPEAIRRMHAALR